MRIISSEGELLADSSLLDIAALEETDQKVAEGETRASVEEMLLYRLATFPIRQYRKYFGAPEPPFQEATYYQSHTFLEGEEVVAALAGEYGAATRISAGGQRSVTLYSALPIRSEGEVIGVVLVSQSTFRILSDLYLRRVEILRVFLYSLVAAAVLSILMSMSITWPLKTLSDQAADILDGRGRFREDFYYAGRKDEIGELSRSLRTFQTKLEKHIDFIESFASDVSHEFKNPLTSIRSSTEMALQARSQQERDKFITIAHDEVSRMERLLRGVREISRIDAGIEEDEWENFDVARLLRDYSRVKLDTMGENGVAVSFSLPEHPLHISGSPDRLVQVVENLLDNAVSFVCPKGSVQVLLKNRGESMELVVQDDGRGIPEEVQGKIFDRFFSYRPGIQKGEHSGLGLAIVKAIVEGYGGSISVQSGSEGTRFRVLFPLTR
jgi:two-component system sensor histidine kinase ChvG